MKKLSILLIIIASLAIQQPSLSTSILDIFSKSEHAPTTKKLITSSFDERKSLFEKSQEDLKKVTDNSKEFSSRVQTLIDQVNAQINGVKEALGQADAQELDYLNKQLSILNETYQSLFNMQLSYKEIQTLLEQLIKLLEEYLKDPDFLNISIKPHAFYTFQDLQEQNKKIIAQEDHIQHLQEQKNEALLELENRTRNLTALKREYQEKKNEQDSFGLEKPSTIPETKSQLDYRKQGTIIDLEVKFLLYEKELAEIKIEEINKKITYLNTNINLETEKLKLFKTDLSKIRLALRIDQKDIQEAQDRLAEFKKKSITARDTYYQNIKEITNQKNALVKDLEALKKKFETVDISAASLRDWNITPKSLQEYLALCELGSKSEQIELLDSIIDQMRAQTDMEKASIKHQEIGFEILHAWFKITRRRFKNNDEIIQELKHFQNILNENKREEIAIKDKRNTANNLLNLKNKILTNLKFFINDFKQQQAKLFNKAPNKFTMCLTRFAQARALIEDQIKSITNITKTYSSHIGIITSTIQDVTKIIAELETKTIWQRSEYAISWEGIKNIPHDLKQFFTAFVNLAKGFFPHFKPRALFNKLKDSFTNPYDGLNLLLKLLTILLCYGVVRYYIPKTISYLRQQAPSSKSLFIINRTIAATLKFLQSHLLAIYLWFILFLLIAVEAISDPFIQIFFYLSSILFFAYLIHQFINYFVAFNKKHEYEIFSLSFQKRFIFVFSFFAYLSTLLLLFRESFIIATYHTSELPTILLATYSIIIRIVIIFSIGKDEILSLIPSKKTGWNTLASFINKYYWPLLLLIIVIMVASDPYVGGYGNLVSYVLWGTIGTLLLIKLLIFGQTQIRKNASYLFFLHEEDTLKERFPHARSFFGLFVIGLFLLCLIIGVFIDIRLWGYSISFNDVASIFTYRMIYFGNEEVLTPLTIIGIIGFIIAGFIIAFAINKFVIGRIFHLLPVDVGIQNTITSIVQYVTIFTAFCLGFYWGNLSSLLIAIGLVIGSLGYILKEPIADFISYFIILVQRPIKIGDYVETNDTTSGVVRQITPRSVILRSKNSFSVIVPNSEVIKNPIKNWNYAGVFVALDDIFFSVPYNVDPEKVRIIISQVLDRSPNILKTPKFIIRLNEFGENGYIFLVRGFISCNKTLDKWDIASDVRFELVKALQANQIPMTLPTRVWLKSAPIQAEELK